MQDHLLDVTSSDCANVFSFLKITQLYKVDYAAMHVALFEASYKGGLTKVCLCFLLVLVLPQNTHTHKHTRVLGEL